MTMHNRLNEIIDHVSKTEVEDEVCQGCRDFCDAFDFEYFVYASVVPTSLTHPSLVYVDNFPNNWREKYLKEEMAAIDPTLSYCMKHSVPIDWKQLELEHELPLDSTNYLQHMRELGLNSGVSFPVHTSQGVRSLFSVASSREYPEATLHIDRIKSYGQLFAVYVNEAMIKLHGITQFVFFDPPISDREKECLLWVAEGKTAWETGQILKIAERTVNFHINNVSTKLGAVNRQQAVARAITLGVIAPSMRRKSYSQPLDI